MSARVTLWPLFASGEKRLAIAEADWSLDKLVWEQARHPALPLKTETWQLRLKSQPGVAVATPLLLRQRVINDQDFFHQSWDGVLGLLLEIEGPRVFQRFSGNAVSTTHCGFV